MHSDTLRGTAVPLALLLLGLIQMPAVHAQEDCFNDDDTLTRNDLEPPESPVARHAVADPNLSRLLASLAEHARRARSPHAQPGTQPPGNERDAPIQR